MVILSNLRTARRYKEEVRQPGPIPVYGSNGQVGWHNLHLVKGPEIIVGRKGNPGTVAWAAADFFAIDITFNVVPKEPCSMHCPFYALERLDLPSHSADSAVPGLNRIMAYITNILVPPVPDSSSHER